MPVRPEPTPPASPLRAGANAGRVALITGGGTGIGRAAACELAATGADVREPDQVQRLVDAAMARFGAIDVLVNSAGGQFTTAAEDISDGGWRAVHRLSVDAVWTLTRTVAVRSMIPRRGGLIVFVGLSPL